MEHESLPDGRLRTHVFGTAPVPIWNDESNAFVSVRKLNVETDCYPAFAGRGFFGHRPARHESETALESAVTNTVIAWLSTPLNLARSPGKIIAGAESDGKYLHLYKVEGQ
jgi:hypothetical protein